MTIEQVRAVAIHDNTLRRLADASLTQVQLDRLSDQVTQLRRRMPDPSAPSAYLAGLEQQRAALLAKSGSMDVAIDVTQEQLDRVVVSIGDLLFPWSTLELPYMTEGINQPPGTADTTGEIATAGLYAGGLGYGATPGGTLTQDGSGGPAERWWIHTWSNSAVFAPAPTTGRLYYRFVVDSECNLYRAPVEAGSIREYVTIGTTSDISSSPPVDQWPTWQTVGWPINQLLPLPPLELDLGGSVTVTGSIPVTAGDSAAIAFIYGTVISIANGLLQLLWGNFGTRRIIAPGGTVGYRDYDKIEYRFEPDWWIEAVNGRLPNAPVID